MRSQTLVFGPGFELNRALGTHSQTPREPATGRGWRHHRQPLAADLFQNLPARDSDRFAVAAIGSCHDGGMDGCRAGCGKGCTTFCQRRTSRGDIVH